MNKHMEHLSRDERRLAEAAIEYLRENKKEIIQEFAGTQYNSTDRPVTIFMAGSPGAGKTEISRNLLQALGEKEVVRLDPDEVRKVFPGYTGTNSRIFQSASSLAIERLHDHVLKKSKSFILDGTFAQYEVASTNIARSVKRGRRPVIIYVYQNPLLAWRFTKKREAKEGRNIPKDAFIEQFFGARETCQKIKDEFGSSVRLWLFERDVNQDNFIQVRFNIDRIDDHLSLPYSLDELRSKLDQE